MNFTFSYPYLLPLLLLNLCFIWCRVYSKHYYFPKIAWLGSNTSLFSLELWIKIVIFSLLVIALAHPYLYDPTSSQNRRGRDLVLAIDASGSMAQSGFDSSDRFKSRYELSLELSKAFVKNRMDDNIGVVVFGSFAYTASPLTYDLAGVAYLLDMSTVGIAGESTAIGDALMQAMHTLTFGEAKNRVIVLLTDGEHNAGKSSPKQAVDIAKEEGIKIYTIGVGKEFDSALLQTIAKETGAKSYSASSAEELAKVYEEIERLEPSAIRSENYLNRLSLGYIPLLLVLLSLSGWVLHQRGVFTKEATR